MDALKSNGQMLDQINLENIPRSGFDLSFNSKGTGKVGRIIPIRCTETLPGDSYKGGTSIAMQFEPLAVPILSNMRLKHETWYVPNNIVWDGWDKFITKGKDLSDVSVVPNFSMAAAFEVVREWFFRVLPSGVLLFASGPFKTDSVSRFDESILAQINQLNEYIESIGHPYRWEYAKLRKIKEASDRVHSLYEVLNSRRSEVEIATHHNTYVELESLRIFVKTLRDTPITSAVSYQVDDLLEYRKKLCDQFLNYIQTLQYYHFSNLPDILSDSSLFIPLYQESKSRDEVDTYRVRSYEDYDNAGFDYGVDNTDFYFSDDDEKLSNAYVSISSKYNVYLPNDFLVTFANFVYDYLAPVLGLGSNLDYLGYRCFTPLDVRYLMQIYVSSFLQTGTISGSTSSSRELNSATGFIISRVGFTDFFDVDSVPTVSGPKLLNVVGQSVLPLRAMYAIWYNNYRDQLLETAAPEPAVSSSIPLTELMLLLLPRQRCWSKDAFTTALANTGTGNMVVPISDVLKTGTSKRVSFGAAPVDEVAVNMLELGMYEYQLKDGTMIQLPTRFIQGIQGGVADSLTSTYAFSLDTLRRVGRMEKWVQKALIYGNRPEDALMSHWAVKIRNERIQLPEFVSSSVDYVKIDTILNNTTTSESVAGDKSGFASAFSKDSDFSYYSPENGVLISFMSVLPEQSYPSGAPRLLSKLSLFDFAFPEFAQIGMDAVYNSELTKQSVLPFNTNPSISSNESRVFGYQGRYYDYKFKHDEEHGALRSYDDMYTFGRDFNYYGKDAELPKLNYRFVHCWPFLGMFVVDDPNMDLFRYDIRFSVAVTRSLPVCGLSV